MKSRLLVGLSALPMILTLFLLRFVPNQIPAHYDLAGNIDRWGSKYELLLLPAVIVLFEAALMIVLYHLKKKQSLAADEKSRQEAKQNESILFYVAVGTWALFTVLHFTLLITAVISVEGDMQTMAVDVWLIANIVVGLLLVVIGNILPKSRRNALLGVRTKWSMANDQTWSMSNRFGGFVMLASGIVIILQSILFEKAWSLIGMLGTLLFGTLLVVWYSWRTYRLNQSTESR